MKNIFRNTGRRQENWERNFQDSFEWDEDDIYGEDGEYSDTEGYSEEGYPQDGEYSEAEGYSEEGYPQDGEYSEAEGYSEENATGDGEQGGIGEAEYAQEEYYGEEKYEETQYSEDADYDENAEYFQSGEYGVGQEPAGELREYDEETSYSQENYDNTDSQYYGETDEYYDESATYGNDTKYYDNAEYDSEEKYNAKASSYAGETRTSQRMPKRRRRRTGVTLMDGMIALSGVAVILLVAGLLIFFTRNKTGSDFGFLTLGNQLQGMEMIGSKGILAVANAQLEKKNASGNLDYAQEPGIYPDPGYQENNYTSTVAVEMKLTSVRKDLKIKFSNRETEKLVGNVRFVAEVTKPDGSKEEWTDSDMDGIIYQKDIADGKYTVVLKAFQDEKYSNYILPAASQTVQVKKNIEYASVDVTGEGRQENEINANLEDTKINDTDVESSLKDTVQWVASTSTGNTYTEVSRSMIPDPLLLGQADLKRAMSGGAGVKSVLALMKERTGEVPEFTPEPTSGPTPEPAESPKPSVEPTESPKPTVEPTESPEPSVEPMGSPDPTESPKPSVEPDVEIGISLNEAVLKLVVTKAADGSISPVTGTARVSLKGAETKDVQFSCKSKDESVATATISKNGEITVTAKGIGTTDIEITAKSGDASGPGSLKVVVSEKPKLTMELDKTELYGFSGGENTNLEVKVTVKNSVLKASEITGGDLRFQAETSDANVARVTEKKITADSDGEFTAILTVTPAEMTGKKSCVLMVSYVEGDESASATCAITIRRHPKYDKETRLLDNKNNQLYVFENNVYREAVYADYYTEVKLFVQSGAKYTGWQTLDGKVYFFNADGNFVTGEQVIQGAKYTFDGNGVLQNGSGVLGIDVSKWNGAIDWKAVKNSGVTFVIIRCGYRGSSQGMLIEDPKFTANIQGATAAGLKVGVYFFTQAVDEVEAVYEASYVIDKVKAYKLSYPIFLDVEPSGGRGDKIDRDTRTSVCKAFCQTIQNAGYTAGIYANKSWLTEKINASELSGYKIWLAQYASAPTYTGRYDMWQYKSTGSISGISGNVDMNLSYMGY